MHDQAAHLSADELAAYLVRHGWASSHADLHLSELPGGVSCHTVLVRRAEGPALVIKQALPQLRTAAVWLCDVRRIEREAAALRLWNELAPEGTVPRFLFLDASQHLLAMEAVAEPHENWKTLLLAGNIDPALVHQFGHLLGSVQARAWRRPELAAEFEASSYFEPLRLEPYYGFSAQQVPAASGFLHSLMSETRATRLTLVHGDFSPKNVLCRNGRLVLLDFEVAHWGDPAFDVGFALAHLLSKAHHLPDRRQALLEAAHEFWCVYWQEVKKCDWAEALEFRVCRHALGCLLARVCGRSPLEYLTADERARQQRASVTLMNAPPPSVFHLGQEFAAKIERD